MVLSSILSLIATGCTFKSPEIVDENACDAHRFVDECEALGLAHEYGFPASCDEVRHPLWAPSVKLGRCWYHGMGADTLKCCESLATEDRVCGMQHVCPP